MKKLFLLFINSVCIIYLFNAQNVGISNPVPTEKLHVDSGSIKIGKLFWVPGAPPTFLKFGDANFVTIGEDEEDDKMILTAKNFILRSSAPYYGGNVGIGITSPAATLSVNRGDGIDGTAAFFGTAHVSHFKYSSTENTYIRGGINNSIVVINDIPGGKVGIGMSNPTRGMIEQYGAVGNTTAIFGSDGTGISLQKNLSAVGFNQYYDGANNRSIFNGYSSQLGLNETDGTLYVKVWSPFSAVPNSLLSNFNNTTRKFHINRFGKVRIGNGSFNADPAMPDLSIKQNSVTPSSGYDRSNGISLGFSACLNDPNTVNLSADELIDGTTYQNALKIFGFPSGGPVAIIHPNTGQYIQLSDRCAKKDIALLGAGTLQQLLQLRPSVYHMANDKDGAKYKYGFVSQEVESVSPDIVFSSGDYKMLAYESFIPIAVRSIQEQQQQIESLQKENSDLKMRREKLEKFIGK